MMMMMMVIESVIEIVTATIVIARVDTVKANDYLTLDITCKDHMIKVTVRAISVHVLVVVEIRLNSSISYFRFLHKLWSLSQA